MRVDHTVPGNAAQVAAGGAGPDEGSRVPGQLRNPGLVAQNTAWRETLSEIRTKYFSLQTVISDLVQVGRMRGEILIIRVHGVYRF